jgi:hypothetical protein
MPPLMTSNIDLFPSILFSKKQSAPFGTGLILNQCVGNYKITYWAGAVVLSVAGAGSSEEAGAASWVASAGAEVVPSPD